MGLDYLLFQIEIYYVLKAFLDNILEGSFISSFIGALLHDEWRECVVAQSNGTKLHLWVVEFFVII